MGITVLSKISWGCSGVAGKIVHTISITKSSKKLSEGNMGVHKAFDMHLERFVAGKVVSVGESHSAPTASAGSSKEAKAARALNHSNVTAIYEIDLAHRIDFLAIELSWEARLRIPATWPAA